MELLVTGGWYDRSGECWIERVAPSGERDRVLTFEPPVPHRMPRKGFTGAAWLGDDLLVCSFDAVWRFDRSWRCTGRLHQPDFNDLHAVAIDEANGGIIVANTGLDAVEIFDFDGRFRGRVALTPGWFEARRQDLQAIERHDVPSALTAGWERGPDVRWSEVRDAYYDSPPDAPFHRRKVRDYLHPNHVTVGSDGALFLTLLATREVRHLPSFRPTGTVDGHPHDGLLVDGQLWLTTTDGRVWCIGDEGARVVLDTTGSDHAGWCRGLAVSDDLVAVGLTELVSQPQYPWRDVPLEQTETSILWFTRSDGELVGRVDLTDRTRHAKVYALLPWSAP